MDKSTMCWDIGKEKWVFVATGHEGAVTCLWVDHEKMVSRSANSLIIIWNKETCTMYCQILSHLQNILSLECGLMWCISGAYLVDQMEISFLSGSAWLIAMILHMQRYVIVLGVLMNMFTLKEKLLISCVLWISYVCDSSKVQMYCLTCSSGCKITVVCYGTYQIMSGDDWGDVATCVKTGELIQKCCAHMGFDMHCSAVWCNADHFIGYTDGNMNVTDIFCGGILATL